jgi:hypothetical protein
VAASMSLSFGSSSGLACRIVVTTPGLNPTEHSPRQQNANL